MGRTGNGAAFFLPAVAGQSGVLAVAGPYRACEGEQLDDLNSILSEQGASEPAEQPAQAETQAQEAQQDEPTGVEGAAPAQTQDDPIETHRKGLETAVVAERRKRQEAEQRAQALEARIAALQQPQQTTQAEGPPDPANYQENPQEYWRLMARYEARAELQAVVRQSQEAQARQAQEAAQRQAQDRVSGIVAAGQAKFQDYDAAINSGLAPFLNRTLLDVIADSEQGAEVSYWLAKNPGEAARVSALPERQMVREVTKLEAKLTKPAAPVLPQTLTTERNAQGRFVPADDTPTLEAILGR